MRNDLLNAIIIALANNIYTFRFEANNVFVDGKDINGDDACYCLTRGNGNSVKVILDDEIINILYDVEQAILFFDYINVYKE